MVDAAGSLVDVEIYWDEEDEPGNQRARDFLAANAGTLQTSRDILREGCVVPLKYEQSYFEEHCDDYTPLRNLSRAFALEIRQAASVGDFSHAVRCGANVFDLANALRRGGLVVDALIAVGFVGIGIDPLRRYRAQLSEDAARMLLGELMRFDAEREPFMDILQRDQEWDAAVGCSDEPVDFDAIAASDSEDDDLSKEFNAAFTVLLRDLYERPTEEKQTIYRDQDLRGIALTRLLTVDLALRLYRGEHAEYPDELDQLVPGILPSLPPDPYTDEPLCYRKTEDGEFLLYSTGPGRTDHGGRFGHWLDVAMNEANLCLDFFDYHDEC